MSKLKQFKNWFFKGRIEKAESKRERIEELSKEYDEGKILNNFIGVKKKKSP